MSLNGYRSPFHRPFFSAYFSPSGPEIGCLITFIPSLLTGLVLYIYLPSGGGRGGSWVTWMGITRHDWVLYHDVASFAFAALLIIHLLLHWRFFRHINKALGGSVKEPCETTE